MPLNLNLNAPTRRTGPPEPWFYHFLELYARLCAGLGVAQFLIASYYALTRMDELGPASFIIGAVSITWMLGAILFACPILLAVDAARHVRAMRYDPRDGRP